MSQMSWVTIWLLIIIMLKLVIKDKMKNFLNPTNIIHINLCEAFLFLMLRHIFSYFLFYYIGEYVACHFDDHWFLLAAGDSLSDFTSTKLSIKPLNQHNGITITSRCVHMIRQLILILLWILLNRFIIYIDPLKIIQATYISHTDSSITGIRHVLDAFLSKFI